MTERLESHRRKRPNQAGFTLIELLVVIIILGILAAVVVFAVGGVGDKGESAAAVIDERTIRTAQEAHCAQFGSYATEAQLVSAGLLAEESVNHDVELGTGGACGEVGTAASSFVVFGPAEEVNIAANADTWITSDTNSGPGYASSAFVYPLNGNTNDPLIIIGSNYVLQPGLAISWELIPTAANRATFTSAQTTVAKPLPAHRPYTLDDDRPYATDTWRFHLRQGVTFNDGSAFDADDVVWTWRDRMPLNAAPLNTVTDTLGFTHRRTGQTPHEWDSVEKIDQFTVDFTPRVQNLRLPEQIGHPKGAIVAALGTAPFANDPSLMLSVPRFVGKHLDGSTDGLPAGTTVFGASSPAATTLVPRSDTNPAIGTGPFNYEAYAPTSPQGGGTARMVRNDGHWGSKAKVKAMNYTFIPDAVQRASGLLSGQFDMAIDLAATDIAAARAAGKNVVTAPFGQNQLIYVSKIHKVTPATHTATFAPFGASGTNAIPENHTFNIAADPAVRRATSLAFDRQAYVDAVYAGNASPGRLMAPPNILGSFQNLVPAMAFDVAQARTVLDAAGWTCGGGAAGANTACGPTEDRVHVTNGSIWDGRTLRLTLIGSPDIPQAGYDLMVAQLRQVGIRLFAIRAVCNSTPCGGIARSQLYASSMWDLDLELPNQNDANPAFLPVLRMACNTTNNGNFRFSPVDSANSTGAAQNDVTANGNGTFPFGVNGCNMAPGIVTFTGLNTAANTTVNPLGPFETLYVPNSRNSTTQAGVQEAAANQMRIVSDQTQSNIVIPLAGQFRIYGMLSTMSLGDPHPSNTSQRWTTLVKL
ncbi:MAG: ABC transporter substrate-binding protein [Acidimicrobiales bacterium]